MPDSWSKTMREKKTVLISGAGPVGLFSALLLAAEGVFVRIFDLHEELQDDPRAATTHPATLEVLGSVGLVDEMKSVGLVAPTFQFWDRPTGSLIATFDLSALAEDTN
jgi:3-(3-hydroxy-phenyl)propionate hydroxylase